MKDYHDFFVYSINGKECNIIEIQYYRLDRVTVHLSNVDEHCYSLTTTEYGYPKLVIHDKETFMKSIVDKFVEG